LFVVVLSTQGGAATGRVRAGWVTKVAWATPSTTVRVRFDWPGEPVEVPRFRIAGTPPSALPGPAGK
jgi:hypothetical protein